MKNNVLTNVALLSCILLGACGDPGYQLSPVGWEVIADRKWQKNFRDFELETRGIHGLIGEWSVDPDLEIRNNKESISLESAELRTANERFPAKIYEAESIPPSKSGYRIPIGWKFGDKRPVPEVIGTHCEIVLNLKVGGESRQVQIEYQKY